MINKNNYEAFFLDYLEGNLSEAAQQALNNFLLQYPELRKELNDMQIIEMEESYASFSQKELKAIPFKNDFDNFCIAKLENDLTCEELKLFDDFLLADNIRTKTYLQYEKTKLVPNKQVLYPYKSSLKKRFTILFPYGQIAVAASIMLFIWVGIKFLQVPQIENQLATLNSLPQASFMPLKNDRTANTLAKSYYPKLKTTQQPQTLESKINQQATPPQKQVIEVIELQIKSKIAEPLLAEATINDTIVINTNHNTTNTVTNSGLANIGLGWKSSQKRDPKSLFYAMAKSGVNKLNNIVKSKIKIKKSYDSPIEEIN